MLHGSAAAAGLLLRQVLTTYCSQYSELHAPQPAPVAHAAVPPGQRAGPQGGCRHALLQRCRLRCRCQNRCAGAAAGGPLLAAGCGARTAAAAQRRPLHRSCPRSQQHLCMNTSSLWTSAPVGRAARLSKCMDGANLHSPHAGRMVCQKHCRAHSFFSIVVIQSTLGSPCRQAIDVEHHSITNCEV